MSAEGTMEVSWLEVDGSELRQLSQDKLADGVIFVRQEYFKLRDLPDKLRLVMEKMKEAKARYVARIEELEASLSLERQNKSASAEEEFESRFKNLQAAYDDLQSKYEHDTKVHNETIDTLQANIAQQKEELRDKIQAIASRMKDWKERTELAEKRAEAADQRILELETHLNDYKNDANETVNALEDKTRKNESLLRELEDRKAELVSQEERQRQFNIDLVNREEALASSTLNLRANESELNQQRMHLQQRITEVQTLQSQLNERERDLAEKQARFDACESESQTSLMELMTKNTDLQSNIKTLTYNVEQKDGELKMLRLQVSQMEQDMQSSARGIDEESNSKITEMESNLQTLALERDNLKHLLEEQKAATEEVNIRIEAIISEHTSVIAERDALKILLDKQRISLEEVVEQSKQKEGVEMQKCREEIELLQQQILEANNEKQKLNEKVEKLEKQLAAISKSADDLSAKQGLSESRSLRLAQMVLDLFSNIVQDEANSVDSESIWEKAESLIGKTADELSSLQRKLQVQELELSEGIQDKERLSATVNKVSELMERLANQDIERDTLAHELKVEKERVTQSKSVMMEVLKTILPIVRSVVPLQSTLLSANETFEDACELQSQLRETTARILSQKDQDESAEQPTIQSSPAKENLIFLRNQSEKVWNEVEDEIRRLLLPVLKFSNGDQAQDQQERLKQVDSLFSHKNLNLLEYDCTLPVYEKIESEDGSQVSAYELEEARRNVLVKRKILQKLTLVSEIALQCGQTLNERLPSIIKLSSVSFHIAKKLARQIQSLRSKLNELATNEQDYIAKIDLLTGELDGVRKSNEEKEDEIELLKLRTTAMAQELEAVKLSKDAALESETVDLKNQLVSSNKKLSEAMKELNLVKVKSQASWPTLGNVLSNASYLSNSKKSPNEILQELLGEKGNARSEVYDSTSPVGVSENAPSDSKDMQYDFMYLMQVPADSCKAVAKLNIGSGAWILLRCNLPQMIEKLRHTLTTQLNVEKPEGKQFEMDQSGGVVEIRIDSGSARESGLLPPDQIGSAKEIADLTCEIPSVTLPLVSVKDTYDALGIPSSSIAYFWIPLKEYIDKIPGGGGVESESSTVLESYLESIPDVAMMVANNIGLTIAKAWKEAGTLQARRSGRILQELAAAEQQIVTLRQEADSAAAQLGLARNQLRERLRAAQRECLRAAALQREVADLRARCSMSASTEQPSSHREHAEEEQDASAVSAVPDEPEFSGGHSDIISPQLSLVGRRSESTDSMLGGAGIEEMSQRLAESQQQVLTLQRLLENEKQNAYSQGLAANRALELARSEAQKKASVLREKNSIALIQIMRCIRLLHATTQVCRDRQLQSQTQLPTSKLIRIWSDVASTGDDVANVFLELAKDNDTTDSLNDTVDEINAILKSVNMMAVSIAESLASSTQAQESLLESPKEASETLHEQSLRSDTPKQASMEDGSLDTDGPQNKPRKTGSVEKTPASMELKLNTQSTSSEDADDFESSILDTLAKDYESNADTTPRSSMKLQGHTPDAKDNLSQIEGSGNLGDAHNERVSKLMALVAELESSVARFRTRCLELEAHVEELELSKRRDEQISANLEYLKNIIVKYMSNPDDHDQLFPVLNTVLQLSPEEHREVASKRQSWLSGRSSLNPLKRWL